MVEITWILKGEKPPSPKFLSFSDRLLNEGVRSIWLNLAVSDSQTTPWLVEHLSSETRYIFLLDTDTKWVREICAILHSFPNPQRAGYPVLWVHDQVDAVTVASLVDTGIDDLVAISENTCDVVPRLRLREAAVQEKTGLLTQMRELKVLEAKQETIMKQREEFLSVCAHDLRSPLGLIQASLSMLIGKGNATMNEFQTDMITRARRQAGQAITLVNDLLDVMSYEQGLKPQYEMLNIHGFLQEFYNDYSLKAGEKGIKVFYENSVKSWRVLADADRIRQLLQNLFVNAVKFTDKDKNIYINVMPFQGRRKSDPPYPMIIVSIKDEGKGIPEKELRKIFDRFTQIKDYNRAEGRGLGLTVAKQISTLHDGNIWVQSVEGTGSTFFVLFPHVISRTLPSEKSKDPKVKKKIVVAESDVARREAFFELMGRWGFELVFSKDGIDTLTQTFHHMPDVVILQPGLNKMDETQVANILKLDGLTVSIPILLAVDSSPISGQKGYDELAYDAIFKTPVNRELFQIALDKAMSRKGKTKRAA